MASLPVWWIAARAYCQATEEEARVVQAIDAAVPGSTEKRERLDGQFGNPVLAIYRRMERPEGLRTVWDRWQTAGLLPLLRDDLERRVDEGGILHFRVDKQVAFEGRLLPAHGGDAIDVQVKLKAYPAKREEILRVARELVAGEG